MNDNNAPLISVVTSLYNSAPYVAEFHHRVSQSLGEISSRYEIILVNDCSPDNALAEAIQLHRKDERVVVVDLSRNFGQHKAMMTGLQHARGDYVFLIEIDLEEQPEWMPDFYGKLSENPEVDVIYGVQKQRKGGVFERFSGALFYKLFNLFSDVQMPENHITMRIMSRRYVDALLRHRDKQLFLGGIYEVVGFAQLPLAVEKQSHSDTTYTLRRKLVLLVNAITSFSTLPLAIIFWIGMLVSLGALAILVYVVLKWLLVSITPGWTSLIASIWAVGGLLMLSIGTVGIYLKKVLEEVKDRPYTVVKQVYRSDENA
ncbi:MAG: glycosyltransferase family 2 protein [Chromatiales bacterium]|jgi:putative glycosyltransferase